MRKRKETNLGTHLFHPYVHKEQRNVMIRKNRGPDRKLHLSRLYKVNAVKPNKKQTQCMGQGKGMNYLA